MKSQFVDYLIAIKNIILAGVFSISSIFFVYTVYFNIDHQWFFGPLGDFSTFSAAHEGDFTNLWVAGGLARAGRIDTIYYSGLFEYWRQYLFGQAIITQDWIYPPFALLIGALVSVIPLFPAFVLWNIGSLAFAVILMRRARLSWFVILVGLLSPADILSLSSGQYGALVGAASVVALLGSRTNPIRSGLLVGLIAMKPQPAMLLPFVWLVQRRWKAILFALLIVLTMAVMVTICFGWWAWSLYFLKSLPHSRAIIEAPFGQANQLGGVSVFWMMRSFGSSIAWAYAAQAASAAGAITLTYAVSHRVNGNTAPFVAFILFMSLLITPYGYGCDMVAFSIALTLLMKQRRGFSLFDPLVWFWLWPGFCPIISHLSGVLMTPLIIVSASWIAWRELVVQPVPPPSPASRPSSREPKAAVHTPPGLPDKRNIAPPTRRHPSPAPPPGQPGRRNTARAKP
jgi:hypothetical protein